MKFASDWATAVFDSTNVVDERVNVECRTLDDEFWEMKKKFGFSRPFLKLDTQGFDANVIRGGLSIIRHFVGFQSELSITPIYTPHTDFRQVLYFYEGLGFRPASFFLPNAGFFPLLIDIDVVMISRPL